MFTGIIEEVGSVQSVGGGCLAIKARKVLQDVRLGDSIAVNGVCLTVTSFDGNSFQADVMPETIRRTSLSELKTGSPVNLERALTLNTRLGGWSYRQWPYLRSREDCFSAGRKKCGTHENFS